MKPRIALSLVFVVIAATALASDAIATPSWGGRVTTAPPHADIEGKPMQISLRVNSMSNALVHEATEAGRTDDPIMTGRMSPEGKTVEFEFLDVAGSTEYGHMHHAAFTVIDANRHTEDCTYMQPGDQPVRAHFRLQRTE